VDPGNAGRSWTNATICSSLSGRQSSTRLTIYHSAKFLLHFSGAGQILGLTF